MTNSTQDTLRTLLDERILLLDGAMGSLIMAQGPTEADYRGRQFANHSTDLPNFKVCHAFNQGFTGAV